MATDRRSVPLTSCLKAYFLNVDWNIPDRILVLEQSILLDNLIFGTLPSFVFFFSSFIIIQFVLSEPVCILRIKGDFPPRGGHSLITVTGFALRFLPKVVQQLKMLPRADTNSHF